MDLRILVAVILVLAIVGVFPGWNHSRSWGYAPSGIIGTLLVLFILLILLKRF